MKNEARLELEYHQLDRRYERLRLRRTEVEKRLLGSLGSQGQQVPIVVVAIEGGSFRVIDGFHRIRALSRLGEDTVWATAWQLSDLEALLLDRGLRSASETAIEQAWLLAELAESFGLEGDELARRFDRSTSWVSRRLALVRVLPTAVQELVREGRISAHTAMRHLVPLARANPSYCAEVASAIARQGLASREVGALIRLLRRTATAHRPKILAHPELALRSQHASGRQEASWLSWLTEVESLAERIVWLSRSVPATLGEEARQRAIGAIEPIDHALEALRSSLCEHASC